MPSLRRVLMLIVFLQKNGSEPPKTAFVSNGFPRPMLAGNRLKDKLKERSSSISGLNMPAPPPSH